MDYLVAVLAAVSSSGVTAIVLAILNRRWAKQDKTDAIVNGLKVLMVDRVRYVGSCYIRAQSISLSDKETLKEMHKAYKELGGNGHLDAIMAEVDKVPVIPD